MECFRPGEIGLLRKMGGPQEWNRLDAKMKLQSDATVNYATGKNIRQVTYSDLEDPSPYNTYKYEGLSPGPISPSPTAARHWTELPCRADPTGCWPRNNSPIS